MISQTKLHGIADRGIEGGRAMRRADGAIQVGNELFLLEQETGDDYRLIRIRDGAEVALFIIESVADAPPRVRTERAQSPKVAQAVAELLSTPRGVVPIQ